MKTGALFNLDNVTNSIGSCRDLICLHRMYHRIFVAQDQAAGGGLNEMADGPSTTSAIGRKTVCIFDCKERLDC